MLQQFIVENFLSFKDRQEFNLQPGKGTKMKEHKVEPIAGQWIIKSSAIFGANASGKSNLIKALALGQRLVIRGTRAETLIDYHPFRLSSKSKNKDTTFIYRILCNNKKYEYGFSYNAEKIKREWLKHITRRKEHIIFERDTNRAKFIISYLEKLNPKEEERQFLTFFSKATPQRQLFLHEVISRNLRDNVSNIEDLMEVARWFINNLRILFPGTPYKQGGMLKSVSDNQLKKTFSGLLKYFDTGIEGIELIDEDINKLGVPQDLIQLIKTDMLKLNNKKVYAALNYNKNLYLMITEDGRIKSKKLQTIHKSIDSSRKEYFSMENESDGTQRIFDYIPLILDLIQGEKVFAIDEMERSLHPSLMRKFVDLFFHYSNKISSQLIFTTHESTLMNQNLFRRDEIWLMEKASNGISSFERLDKKFSPRFDKSLEKAYLKGLFGAVPIWGEEEMLKFVITP